MTKTTPTGTWVRAVNGAAALALLVLYGSHVNGTLPDPDEVDPLAALAKAAAASHQQVRIGTLSRRNEQLEASVTEQRALVRERMTTGS